MKRILMILVVILIVVIVTTGIVIYSNLAPVLDYNLEPIPKLSTDIQFPTSAYNAISLSPGNYLVLDDDTSRILEYNNYEFGRMIMGQPIVDYEENLDDFGRVRSFAKIDNKIYISTTERVVYIIDPQKSKYDVVDITTFALAENEGNEIFMQGFDKTVMQRFRDGSSNVLFAEVPALYDMHVMGDNIYALARSTNSIISIDKMLGNSEVIELIRLPTENQIISFDLHDGRFYLLIFNHQIQKNQVLIYDGSKLVDIKKLDHSIEFGRINMNDEVLITDTQQNKIHIYDSKFNLKNQRDDEIINQVYDFFDPRYAVAYKDGLLVSDDDNHRIIYLVCNDENEDCSIEKQVKVYRPRQLTVKDGIICAGKYQNGVICYDENLSVIKSIVNYEDDMLVQTRGVQFAHGALYVAESSNGCIYKYDMNFNEVQKKCEFIEPRYMTLANNYLVVVDASTNYLSFLTANMNEMKGIKLEEYKARGAYLLGNYMYVVYKNIGLHKLQIFENGSFIDSNEIFVDNLVDARGVEGKDGLLYVSDEGDNAIKVYRGDRLIATIDLDSLDGFHTP